VISPSVDADALAARLDRLPTRLRTSLARAFDRLARDAGLSFAIDATADAVTATVRTAALRPTFTPTPTLPRKRGREFMGVAAKTLPRLRGREDRRVAASGWGLKPPRSPVSSARDAMALEIRADLETAARQALAE
jgi:hypothetical protein